MPEDTHCKKKRIENPFIKAENREWSIAEPASLKRPISPPPSTLRKRKRSRDGEIASSKTDSLPKTAAIEAGEVAVTDNLSFWSTKLQAVERQRVPNTPGLAIWEWKALYSLHAETTSGSHFVIHQHDHPVAGIHYDLRLQCNPTSSISFAIMYGLPGDPNSRRLYRNATETRVHCMWNHLIETASLSTGTVLIWDTGHYEVLRYKEEQTSQETDDDSESFHSAKSNKVELAEQQKLHTAFRSRKIRLRLHGTRLPQGYTISLRLTKENYRSEQPPPPSRKRKRKPSKVKKNLSPKSIDSGSSSDSATPLDMGPFGGGHIKRNLPSLLRQETPPLRIGQDGETASPSASDNADPGGSESDTGNQGEIHKTNAYPGATNDIESIHQRKWYLSMDRRGSGFIPGRDREGHRLWARKRNEDGSLGGFERFHVLGRDAEPSVVTGRLAKDILGDEDVQGFVPRGLWKGVTE